MLQTIIRPPTQEEQVRLLRYAFWIKWTTGIVTRRFGPFFEVLRLSSPTRTPFPNLRGLSWSICPSLLHFLHLFISPRVTTFLVKAYSDTSFDPNTTERERLVATVTALPTSLREFTLCVNAAGLGSDELKKGLLNTIRRCGRTLTHLEIDTELSEITIHHVMQLPNLRTWRVHRSSLPAKPIRPLETSTYLPALRSLALSATNTCEWVAFLASSYTTADSVCSTLTKLNLRGRHAVDPTLITQICAFRNLTHLDVGLSCPEDGCAFALADDDLSRLSLALPQLEWLMLGHQCDRNTCMATFRSLLFLSARCPRLAFLSVHFNTVQIAQDIESLFKSGDPGVKELRDSPTRCQIGILPVSQTPLFLGGSEELDVVKRGFLNVFPQLKEIARRYGRAWQSLTEALRQ